MTKAYAPGSLQMIPGEGGMYSAVNPRTGKSEPVYLDNDTSQMYFASDGDMPATASQAGAPSYHTDNGKGILRSLITEGGPVMAAALGGAAGLGALGVGGAGAMTAADAAALGGMTEGTAGAVGASEAASPMLLADAGTTMTDVGAGMGTLDGGAGVTGLPMAAAPAPAEMAAGGADLGGGLGVDEFGNVTGGAMGLSGGAAGGLGLGGINPALLGMGAGALLGGLGGGSRPAGTTTTVQDVPEWLKPYVMQNLNAAGSARDALISGPNATSAAMPEYMKTVNGAYLDPSSNPWLDATYKHAAGLVGSGVDSRFEAAGRYGSGAHQGVLQEGMNNLATSIYGGNYQAERARQNAAVTGAPGFDTNRATAAYAPYTGYSSLFPNSRSTTTPYFNNPGAGILGGALAGGALSRMWG